MAVPNIFGNVTTTIPLSQLDQNFATAITLGNTAVYLGNTTTSLGNVTLTNANIASVAVTIPNSFLANSAVTIGNTSVSLGSTGTSFGNVSLDNAVIGSGTPAALAATTGTFSGQITSTVGNSGIVLYNHSATTGYIIASDIQNTGSRHVIGIDNSTGNSGLLSSGSSAYATVISTQDNHPVIIGVNALPIGNFSSIGVSVTGTGSFSGQILAAGIATGGTAFGVMSNKPGVFKSATGGGSVGISLGADASDYGSVGYNLDFTTASGIKFLAGDWASRIFFNAQTMTFQSSTVQGSGGSTISWNTHGTWNPTSILPGVDNTSTNGSGALRWSTVYAATGTINTSDAREKTAVSPMTSAEIEASKQLAREIGTYKWLSAIAEKGDEARKHVGFTVQKTIEIMQANGLDPMAYGFICYDSWGDEFLEHPAIEAKDAVLGEDGEVLEPAVEAKAAWTEQTQKAGDRYSFRYDELNLFIARGFEARLSALEGK